MSVRIAWLLVLGAPLAASFALPVPGSSPAGPDGALDLARVPCCAFRLVSGLPCPLCGLTRSFVSLAHGRWRDAFLYHPLGPLVFAAFVGGALFQLRPPRRAPAGGESPPAPWAWPRAAAWAGAALLLGAWGGKLVWIPRLYW